MTSPALSLTQGTRYTGTSFQPNEAFDVPADSSERALTLSRKRDRGPGAPSRGFLTHFASEQPHAFPRAVDGIDVRSLPIGPEEAFVLSRIDGMSSESDISAATGLSEEKVHTCLAKLAELGAVQMRESTAPRPTQGSVPAQVRISQAPSEQVVRTSKRPSAEPPTALPHNRAEAQPSIYDPGEVNEDVDLPIELRRQVLDLFHRMGELNHYEVLGIDEDADRKAIKSAYFSVVNTYHPDRYFDKNLGSYKTKLEKVFARLTEAHEALSRNHSREEYDEYLKTRRRASGLDQAMRGSGAHVIDVERLQAELEAEVKRDLSTEPASRPNASRRPNRRAVPPPMNEDERRKAMARKLRGSMSHQPAVRPPSPPDAAALRQKVAEDLKHRYSERLAQARSGQVQRYVEQADVAVKDQDLASAANYLRIALSLSEPEDPQLARRLREVEKQAYAQLGDTFHQQAQYEERTGHMAKAARSYERAATGKQEGFLFHKAAHCLLEAGGNSRRAVELARQAVGLVPNDAQAHFTLAKSYVAAGFKASVLAELERAHELSPDNETIKDWVNRAKRGEL